MYYCINTTSLLVVLRAEWSKYHEPLKYAITYRNKNLFTNLTNLFVPRTGSTSLFVQLNIHIIIWVCIIWGQILYSLTVIWWPLLYHLRFACYFMCQRESIDISLSRHLGVLKCVSKMCYLCCSVWNINRKIYVDEALYCCGHDRIIFYNAQVLWFNHMVPLTCWKIRGKESLIFYKFFNDGYLRLRRSCVRGLRS